MAPTVRRRDVGNRVHTEGEPHSFCTKTDEESQFLSVYPRSQARGLLTMVSALMPNKECYLMT